MYVGSNFGFGIDLSAFVKGFSREEIHNLPLKLRTLIRPKQVNSAIEYTV
jgi:hypothetical protein